MTGTREDVVALARAMFGEEKLAAVLAALDEYGTEPYEREVDRVKVAVLRLSEGRIDKLQYWVKTAKVDYRDPLAALELGPLSPEEGARFQAAAQKLIERWGKK